MSRENLLSKSKKHLGRNDRQAGVIRDLPDKGQTSSIPGISVHRLSVLAAVLPNSKN